MYFLDCYASSNDASDVYTSNVWLNKRQKNQKITSYCPFFKIVSEKIKIIISFNEYIKKLTILQAGITKLVNGAGLFWNIILINRNQDLFIILSVD